jgi:hypothetical protein
MAARWPLPDAAIFDPHNAAEHLSLSQELRDVAEQIGDRERVVAGYFQLFIAWLHAGEVRSAKDALTAGTSLAETLRQPSQLWQVNAAWAMLALAEGRLADAEALMDRIFALGERAQRGIAVPAHTIQSFTRAYFRDRLQDIEANLGDVAEKYRTRPVLRCALALLHARLGHATRAHEMLSDLTANSCSVLPLDIEWLYSVSLLAESSALLGDAHTAAILYQLLAPHAAANVADTPEAIGGSVARYLGLLAGTLGRRNDAVEHFETATAANERMGFRPWHAHAQLDYARTLLARNEAGDGARAKSILEDARTTYQTLNMHSWEEEATALAHHGLTRSAPR